MSLISRLIIIIAMTAVTSAPHAQTISALPPATTPLTGAEFLPMVQNGTTKRATVSNLTTLPGLGSVTSVNGSGGSTGLSMSGGPITASGTLTLGGTLNATYGGTGQTTYSTGDILYGANSTTLARLAAGTNGYVMTMSGGLPSWAPAGAGTVTSVTCGSNLTGGTITTSGTCGLSSTLIGLISATSQSFSVNVTSGTLGGTTLYQAGSPRWFVGKNGTESGVSSGSDFYIGRYDNSGVGIDNPILITRADGIVHMADGWMVGAVMSTVPGQTAVNGSVVGIDTHITDGVTNPNVYAGYFSGPIYTMYSFDRTFDSSYTGSGVAATVASNAYVNGSTSTPMPYFGVCFNQTTGGHCEGMNLVVTDDNVHTIGSLNGLEVDIEASSMHQPSSNANGIVVAGLNTNYSNAIEVETSGSVWQNGVQLSGASYSGFQLQCNSCNIDTSGVFNHTSDERLKNVGAPLTDALSKLRTIRTFYYTCKALPDDLVFRRARTSASVHVPVTIKAEYLPDQRCGQQGHTYLGVSAQDVQKVFKEDVSTDPENGTLSVNYAGLVTPLIEAVRELKSDNDNLRREVDQLRHEVRRKRAH